MSAQTVRVAVVAAALLCSTTACGGSQGPAAATDQSPGRAQVPDAPRTAEFAGAAGEIADIQGATMQVQNPVSGQVAVSFTKKTTITAQVVAHATDLKVGDCVMVTGEADDAVAATSVRITRSSSGSCAPAIRGGFGPGPGQAPPSGMPSGAPDRVRMGGVFGKVVSITESGFTVETTQPGQNGTSRRGVTTSSATSWTDTVKAAASALKVGRCVVAPGARDSTGAVTASTIEVSDKVDGQCVGGMRRVEGGQP